MKKIILTLACALAVFGLTASNAVALPLINVQSSSDGSAYDLWDLYASYYSVGCTEAQLEALEDNAAIAIGLFTASGGTITPLYRYAGNPMTLGYYLTDGTQVPLQYLNPSGGPLSGLGPYSVPGGGTEFGVYGYSNGSTWYSQISKNTDTKYHWAFFNSPSDPNEKFVGFEDLTTSSGSDWDYNDFVFKFTNFSPVPEPASLSLFGIGLLGALGARFRRKK